MVEHHQSGNPSWSSDSDNEQARKYVNNLLNEKAAVRPCDDDFNYNFQLPEWYDEKKYKLAQQFYRDNLFAMFTGKVIGLVAAMAIPSILRIFIHTKETSTTMRSYRRYMGTLYHLAHWYSDDLKPGTQAWKSLEMVRKRHIHVSRSSDGAANGVISQRDLATTQFAFAGFMLLKPHVLGVQVSRENFEALAHFWRVIGYLLGTTDEYNLFTDRWETTLPRMELLMEKIVRPNLINPPAEFTTTVTTFLGGLWYFNPLLAPDSFIYFTKMTCDCPGYSYLESGLELINAPPAQKTNLDSMGWLNRFLLWLLFTVHAYLLNFAVFRFVFNVAVALLFKGVQYIPVMAIINFGFKNAYIKTLRK